MFFFLWIIWLYQAKFYNVTCKIRGTNLPEKNSSQDWRQRRNRWFLAEFDVDVEGGDPENLEGFAFGRASATGKRAGFDGTYGRCTLEVYELFLL